MIHVVVITEVKDGKRDAFLEEFRKIVPLVREENGCIGYGPTVDVEVDAEMVPPPNPNRVTIIEQWENTETLKAHLVAPHMLEYRPKVKDYVKSVQAIVTEPA